MHDFRGLVATGLVSWLCVTTAGAAEPVDYLREIKPILRERCFACHGALKQKSGLRVDTGVAMRTGGDAGPVIVAGQPAESELFDRITTEDETLRMPPEGQPLTSEQIAKIQAWIEQGAKSPEDEPPEVDPREHWSFQKPVRPNIPAGSGNPIDALIRAQLEKQGLQPRPLAEKPVLLRRVYLDLIGVPPTREELHAFLADEAPDAYDKVVDRLLLDPRYGERWARHWMDIWRYSDWFGRRHVPDVWNSAPQIWRWRDWIVQSLNHDKGYDRMVQEMLAADEVCPEDAEAAYATGYLIRNWYALNPNDWMRSTVEHTGKAFLGLTFNCAHCHDHKYDPISQDDYFRLRAFFEPIHIRQDRVPGEADPGPFQEYDYGKLRIIQRLGSVSIFEKDPQAPTWFYTGGDERNRVSERGSIAPGVPAFLNDWLPEIASHQQPPRFWYPALRPEMQATILADYRTIVSQREAELSTIRSMPPAAPAPELQQQLAQAQAAYDAAMADASQKSGVLAGKQSLLLDATQGRRIVQNGLQQLKALNEGMTLSFQLQILADAHVNFQFAKDVKAGLTAGFVAFEKGRIISYQPGTFTEFDAGKYDAAAPEKRFAVTLLIEPQADRCLLSVRSLADDTLLAENIPVALNGWNPVGDATKAITFDARTGSLAVIDEVALAGPAAGGETAGGTPEKVVTFDFEPPLYADGADVIGVDGWTDSTFSVAPATSMVSAQVAQPGLRELAAKLQAARRLATAGELRLAAAAAKLAAAQLELASVEARMAADKARYGETPEADAPALIQAASRLEREAALRKAEADVLAADSALATAEGKPAADANRAKEIETATKQLAAARTAVTQAQTALNDPAQTDKYSPFGPVYPQTTTGRRLALVQWMTNRENPLTARVAVNHIWTRHFHTPLVSSVFDFGRNGALPTHPELLDWLAVELMESGWSMKHLHRVIVTSEAYRRVTSAGPSEHEVATDPENKQLWRMNAGRMEAEVLRDSLLAVAGKLDYKMGGQELENSEALTSHRRSLYFSVFPEQGGKSELGELFDAPNPADCYRRTRSVVPQQALALTNSELVHQLSTTVATLVRQTTDQSAASESLDVWKTRFIVTAFEQILSRTPSDLEIDACRKFTERQAALLKVTDEKDAKVWESLVRALLNHNDFVAIR